MKIFQISKKLINTGHLIVIIDLSHKKPNKDWKRKKEDGQVDGRKNWGRAHN